MDTNSLTVASALELLQGGKLTPPALAEACLAQIERLNPRLNAFITITRTLALSAQPSAGSLAGIPIAVKDLFETAGIRTTAGSKFFEDYVPREDAFVLRKLKAAGAVVIGKTNTHEIALGVTTNNPHFGTCRNPWDPEHIPGGSSGGSAVAVATGMALAALGTDTGGSIRIPAALCGVVGLKPTRGRVSLRGVIPLSWNLDHAGPITKTVGDAALMLQVMAGYDPENPGCVDAPVQDYLARLEEGIGGWRIALAAGEYIEDCDAQVLTAVQGAAGLFESAGAIVESVDMDWLRAAAQANGVMTPADAAAFHRERLAAHPDWFGADVRQRLETGRAFTSTEYALARRTQSETRRRFDALFARYDILLLPATPIPAPLIEGNDAVEQARRLTRFTAPFNLAGLPALSIPCGFSDGGLPIGSQLAARAWNEAGLLRAARAYERQVDWGARRPLLGQ